MKRMYTIIGLFGFVVLLGTAGSVDLNQMDSWTVIFRVVFGMGLIIVSHLYSDERKVKEKVRGKNSQSVKSKAA